MRNTGEGGTELWWRKLVKLNEDDILSSWTINWRNEYPAAKLSLLLILLSVSDDNRIEDNASMQIEPRAGSTRESLLSGIRNAE